jgi:hypothetical protein
MGLALRERKKPKIYIIASDFFYFLYCFFNYKKRQKLNICWKKNWLLAFEELWKTCREKERGGKR